jgi:trehalose-6-phosphate synthase
MKRMRRTVKEHNVYRWAADLISELAEIRLDAAEGAETHGATIVNEKSGSFAAAQEGRRDSL